ncbi:hypothetical protein RHSIM_RhsimUnG0215100 [Rhododendron simsii]|uniref:Uncharacterized protein n=1 Tax=Rhododendron simsii TaxID=118357 RepID=A0A834FVV4_RHOSS|nr:hypothetical protein RHSIM_RhsimUnG0215100 [Rhododendron simsii]
MRKGAKRKASEKEEKTTKTESSKAGGRRKKVKPSKPESEPEFFPDRRNLEDLWKQVFPVGTEWDQLDQVYQYKWNFSNLENAFEEGGELYGQKVFLFGSTEREKVAVKLLGINRVHSTEDHSRHYTLDILRKNLSCIAYIVVANGHASLHYTWSLGGIHRLCFAAVANLKIHWRPSIILGGLYLLRFAESQLVFFKDEGKVTCIPVVVAVDSPFPPSDKIGINSVQREAEEIVPMKQMKMDWVPYIPLEDRDSRVERLKSQIFILSCTQRRAGLRHLKLERMKEFEYCLPYFYQPLQEDEFEQSTIVQIMFPAEPKPTICEFDWELDELEEFTDKLIEEEELSADQKDAFKDFVRKKVSEGKKANREAREARKKALAEMSEETKTAFQNMKFYKFYPVPTPDSPDVSNVKVIFAIFIRLLIWLLDLGLIHAMISPHRIVRCPAGIQLGVKLRGR